LIGLIITHIGSALTRTGWAGKKTARQMIRWANKMMMMMMMMRTDTECQCI